MAPIAPIAPAWFTVAIPIMIEPKTVKINVSGGTSAITTFNKNLLSIFPL